MIHWLNTVLFTLGNDRVSWAELLGFLSGGWCVWLTVRAHIADFAVGIANSALFLVLFASAHLWADASLQIVFVVLGFLGWWQWVRGRRSDERGVEDAGAFLIATLLVSVVAATLLLTWVLGSADDAAPFWDAVTTSLSLAAQYLLNTRRVQTWWFWITADVIYVPLYVFKRLDLTAVVYVLFLVMCFVGLKSWRAEQRNASGAAPRSTSAAVTQ